MPKRVHLSNSGKPSCNVQYNKCSVTDIEEKVTCKICKFMISKSNSLLEKRDISTITSIEKIDLFDILYENTRERKTVSKILIINKIIRNMKSSTICYKNYHFMFKLFTWLQNNNFDICKLLR